MRSEATSRCPVCGGGQVPRIAPWTARCTECGTWSSSLTPALNASTLHAIDEDVRSVGLERLRRDNYRVVVERIGRVRPLEGLRLLDVGCAHGWFLDAARSAGADAAGVEPDAGMVAIARASGHEVVEGLFPDVVEASGPFGAITFNDVLEHIPDVRATLTACARLLEPGGALSINIPSADGLAYRAGRALARAGVGGPYERLWQRGLPSPHLHYFPPAALARLVGECGFEVRVVEPLASIVRAGLWERVHTYRERSVASVCEFAALWLAAPVLSSPRWSDIVHLIAIRR